MIVYWEYAFIENALIDGLLLYLALRCTRLHVRVLPLLMASAAGGAFAVVFPLFSLPAPAAYCVKILSGIVFALIACGRARWRPALVTVIAFFILTFLLGGILTAIHGFFGTEMVNGTGFYVERAPIGLVLGGGGCFAVGVICSLRVFRKRRGLIRNLMPCTLSQGERTVHWTGFADSGNCLTFRGAPVCVVSPAGIFALFGRHPQAVGHISVTTVNGVRISPVFFCEHLAVDGGTERHVFLTIGEIGRSFQILLHPGISEAIHEHTRHITAMASKNRRGRKCRSLSVRKRGASTASLAGGGSGAAGKAGSGQGRGGGQGEADRT